MIELIPNWRAWYKRWSTWLLLILGGINLNDVIGVMPSIQQYVDPDLYRWIMIALPLAVIAVTNIKQKSVSGSSS